MIYSINVKINAVKRRSRLSDFSKREGDGVNPLK